MPSSFAKPLIIPEKISADEKNKSKDYAKFIAEPYERGYGHTIGNSFRRILLSSLEGAAVVAVRMKGARHEYATIHGVQEDVINILLNLKKLRIKMHSEGPETLLISVRGKREVTAADIKGNPNVEIANKDLIIAHVESGSVFEAELEVARGSGYITSEEIKNKTNLPADFIPMDAIFSPVQKVYYTVENARVGQRTDYDRLVLEVWTDGTITPEEAVNKTAALLRKSLLPFIPPEEIRRETMTNASETKESGEKSEEIKNILEQSVDIIELSSRAANCLKVAGIRSVGELVQKTDDDLLAVKNFGKKSLDEIKERLREMGLSLGMKAEGQ
ncbi:MAG: DNA-directed RNA polymerase subunit alpha [Elusimicrobia bacterium]|nr:DNA-directed RNA polymerase subunit alpha [Elusimicrobiota bacterium]